MGRRVLLIGGLVLLLYVLFRIHQVLVILLLVLSILLRGLLRVLLVITGGHHIVVS